MKNLKGKINMIKDEIEERQKAIDYYSNLENKQEYQKDISDLIKERNIYQKFLEMLED